MKHLFLKYFSHVNKIEKASGCVGGNYLGSNGNRQPNEWKREIITGK